MAAHFLDPLLDDDAQGHYCLTLKREAAAVALTIETAFDSASRNRGLLGRDRLAQDSVLILAPCNSVHTFNMQFPIDIMFARRDGSITKMARHVRPWRISIAWKAFATIECAAGTIDRCHIQIDDRLVVRKRVGK